MDLSTAIREGAQRRPQGHGAFFTTLESGEVGSCAMGAAYEGLTGRALAPFDVGLDDTPVGYAALSHLMYTTFPIMYTVTALPCDCEYLRERYAVKFAVEHLNDAHRWSREQIADWLETL